MSHLTGKRSAIFRRTPLCYRKQLWDTLAGAMLLYDL
jgi:hypothetical protein